MKICNCYKTDTRKSARYNQYTGQYSHSIDEKYSYCSGTREQDECNCGGCRARCTHYPEEREKYNREQDYKLKLEYKELHNSIELNKELIKAIICFSDMECKEHCTEYECTAHTEAYNLGDTVSLFKDILEHLKNLNNIINEQQTELNKTRQFIHDNSLTFELLNYSIK